jgi:hypothetical protein
LTDLRFLRQAQAGHNASEADRGSALNVIIEAGCGLAVLLQQTERVRIAEVFKLWDSDEE